MIIFPREWNDDFDDHNNNYAIKRYNKIKRIVNHQKDCLVIAFFLSVLLYASLFGLDTTEIVDHYYAKDFSSMAHYYASIQPPQNDTNPGIRCGFAGHKHNCTVSSGQHLDDATIYWRFFQGGSPLAHLSNRNAQQPHQQKGFVVEMGATDGIESSNSLLFEQCTGWDSLILEANPNNYAKLQTNRPCATNIAGAVCRAEDGPSILMDFLVDGDDTDSPFGAGGVRGNVDAVGRNLVVVDVPCAPLSSIFEYHGITRINFFSLHANGDELKILETIDWNKVQIDVLLVETNYFEAGDDGSSAVSEQTRAVRELIGQKTELFRVLSRLDREKDTVCERNGYKDQKNCAFLSIEGADVYVSLELYEYDTFPWLYPGQ